MSGTKRAAVEYKSGPLTIERVIEGRLEGYASTFGNVDRGRDRCVKGCFTDTLRDMREKGGRFPWMLYGHDTDKIVGEFESMEEDDRGLRVVGKLWLDDAPHPELAKMIVRAIQSKAGPMGMSIGYRTKLYDFDKDGIRNIKAAELLEVSLVPIPMNPDATVSRFKSASNGDLPGIRAVEAALRDEFGFSRAQAECIATHGYKHFLATQAAREEPASGDGSRASSRDEERMAAAVAALRRNIQVMRGNDA